MTLKPVYSKINRENLYKTESLKKNHIFPLLLILYHLGFSYFGWHYIVHHGGDAQQYWMLGKDLSQLQWADFLHVGTDVVKLITFPLVKYLHLPFFAGFLLFSLWSGYGFRRLWKWTEKICGNSRNTLMMGAALLMLPNMHFWTSLPGKEALLFVPIVVITEKMYDGKWKSFALVTSLLLIAVIRPHMAFVVLLAACGAVLLKGRLPAKKKALFLGGAVLSGVLVWQVLLRVAKVEGSLFERLVYLYRLHNEKLKETAAYVPLEDYTYPYKMVTFFFRPWPGERNGFLYQVLGGEGVLLAVICTAAVLVSWKYRRNLTWNIGMVFSVLLLVLYGTMYVYAYANFGLIVRTRSLTMPALILLLVSVFRSSGGKTGVRK